MNGTLRNVGCTVRAFGRLYDGAIERFGPKRVDVSFTTGSGRFHRRTVPVVAASNGDWGYVAVIGGGLDALTRELTAFASFSEMVNAEGGFRPTLLPRDTRWVLLANAYDRFQAQRNDPRRAFRG